MSTEIEQEARKSGWTPLENFKGDPDKWVDAEEWVDRGQHVMPILSANNRRLQGELLTRDQKIGNLQEQLDNTKVALEKLEEHYSAATKRAVETAKKDLMEQLKTAREDNDVDAEEAIREQLATVRETQKAADKADEDKKAKGAKPSDTNDSTHAKEISPDFKAWHKDNPWFDTDKKKTKNFVRLAEDLREEGNTQEGLEFFMAVEEAYVERYGDPNEEEEEEEKLPVKRPVGKVQGAHTRGTSSKGKGFASLPQDAKAACHADIDDLVGEGKLFKTVSEWETYYTEKFYGEQA